jgi:Fe-S-cluster-containing dehydrogenase component
MQQTENTMKTIKNFLLVLTLTASIALADDGHTNGGNRCETCTPPPCTENCPGFAEEEGTVVTLSDSSEETSFTEYFSEIFFDLFS